MKHQSAYDKSLLREMCEVAASCYDRGWCYGTAGNFSVKAKEGYIWQSPTARNKGALTYKSFIAVDAETGKPYIPYGLKPSGEMPIHLAIYKMHPEAKCIVHAHPKNLVALSLKISDSALTFQGEEMQKHLGSATHLENLSIPIIENLTPDEMIDYWKKAAPSKPSLPLKVFRGHGVYAFSSDPLMALAHMEALDFLCESFLLRTLDK